MDGVFFLNSVSQFQIETAAYLIINSDNRDKLLTFVSAIFSEIRDEQIRNGWSYTARSDKLERYMSRMIITNQLTYFRRSSLTFSLNFTLSENKMATEINIGRGHPVLFKVCKYEYKLTGVQSNTTYNFITFIC